MAQHMSGVTALAAPGLQHATRLGQHQHGIDAPLLGAVLHKPASELAQHRVAEARVAELQTQQVLPVNAGAHRVGCLAVGQTLHELQQRRQGQAYWRLGRLAARREQVGEIVVRDDHVQLVEHAHDGVALGQNRLCYLSGAVRHHGALLGLQRHHTPLSASSAPAAQARVMPPA